MTDLQCLMMLADAYAEARVRDWRYWNDATARDAREARAEFEAALTNPIDMILHCPKCGIQHIDKPDPPEYNDPPGSEPVRGGWTNPHRSHLCAGCGYIWRPADVPTNGVAAIQTKGKADSPPIEVQIATVWHEGSKTFYRARLLNKLTNEDVQGESESK